MSRQNEPQDKACLAGIICFILGLGTLLPWNFFITAIPYFHWRLYNNSSANGNISASENQNSGKDDLNFNNWMTLLAQLPLLLCTLLNSFIYQCISQRIRIAGSMLAILALFILTAVLVKIEMDPQTTFFSLTLATIWFINAFCAILQGSLFGLLTLFPQKYSSLFLSGQGMAGMFAALAMILSMLSGADHTTIALSYFITPCIGTCISIICYLLLPRLDFAQHYLSKSNTNSSKSYEMETKTELLHPGEENGDAGQKKAVLLLKEAEACAAEEKTNVSICTILKKIWVMALTIVLTFGVTLSVFPAITTKVVTNVHNNENWSNFFTPVCCFLIFNVMDFFGRWLTSKTLWPGPDCKYLPLMAASRFIFVPLFMFCNINADRHYLSSFFVNDAWFIIFMAFFSVSNGYFVSLPMCLAPKKVLPHESETTGALMTFFLALGLSVGAGLSFAFKELL